MSSQNYFKMYRNIYTRSHKVWIIDQSKRLQDLGSELVALIWTSFKGEASKVRSEF